MSSTQGFQTKSVFMSQGTSHLRVSSSAEFKVAAGGQLLMDYERATGRAGTISNRGITYVLSSAIGSTFYLKAPVRGAYKQLLIRTKAATSGFIRIRTTGVAISIQKSSLHSIFLASSHGKKLTLGIGMTLVGGSTAQWLILSRSILSTATTGAALVTLTSSTGV